MKDIKNTAGMSDIEIKSELQNGARFVVFTYCISVIFVTFERSSKIHFIKSGKSVIKHALPYILISLIFGWWSFPWGPMYTIISIYSNLSGGKDITKEILSASEKS